MRKFAVILMLYIGVCSAQGTPPHHQIAMDIINTIDQELDSKEYIELYMLTENFPELTALLEIVRKDDYKKPKALYKIENIIDFSINELEIDYMFTQQIKEHIQSTLAEQFITAFDTHTMGLNFITLAQFFMPKKFFVDNEITDPFIYLYTFDAAVNIAVLFIPRNDGFVEAKGVITMQNQELVRDNDIEQLGISIELVQSFE